MKLHNDLREFVALLLSRDVEFVVVGGHAVAYHGYPRLTEDLNLLTRANAEVGMISKSALIRNKRATGRTQDLADAERLEATSTIGV